mmetsp:Transcript_41074/g.88817  ORF Transcript_41074/g.88817 Transcript_41074/m.88817 type:complete len:127 (+) Transcript_41074:10-390(+)
MPEPTSEQPTSPPSQTADAAGTENPEPPPPGRFAWSPKRKKQLMIVSISLGILLFLAVAASIDQMRFPMVALLSLLISVFEVKWEQDSWLATGSRRPLRILLQVFLVLTPLALSAWMLSLMVVSQS